MGFSTCKNPLQRMRKGAMSEVVQEGGHFDLTAVAIQSSHNGLVTGIAQPQGVQNSRGDMQYTKAVYEASVLCVWVGERTDS